MKTKLERIKAALRAHIEEAEKATAGPWEASKVDQVGGSSIYGDVSNPDKACQRLVASGAYESAHEGKYYRIIRPIYAPECDANTAFIAHARTMSPAACKALLACITQLERINSFPNFAAEQAFRDIEAAFTHLITDK